METSAILIDEDILKNNEKFKNESKYIINSNKNNCFNIFITNLTSYIQIKASYQNIIKMEEFKEKINYWNKNNIYYN